MASIQLTNHLTLEVNTMAEGTALMNLLYNNEIGELVVGSRAITLCSNTDGDPEVVYGNQNFRVMKAKISYDYTDADGNTTKEDEMVDVWDVKRQLDAVTLPDRGYGNYAHISWDMQYMTIALKTNKLIFKISEMPALTSDNTEINDSTYPKITNLGKDEDDMFHAIVESKETGERVRLFMDLSDPINSYFLYE